MEMMAVSSQQALKTPEKNPSKQETTGGAFESILKSILPEEEKPEGESKKETVDLSSHIFMGQAINVLAKEVIPQASLKDSLTLKTQVEDSIQVSPKEVLPDVKIQNQIPKEMTDKNEFIKDVLAHLRPESKTLDKTQEALNQNEGIKVKLEDGGNLEKDLKVFSLAYREVNYSQKIEGENIEKVMVLGKSSEKPGENIIKESPNLEKNQQSPIFSLEKLETSFKLEQQDPGIKTNQDNIIKVQDTMIKLLETTREGETTSMKISLQPENLGKVDIGLKMEGGKLTASILVENNQVRDLFTIKLGELNQSLAKQNLIIDKIQVQVKDQGPSLEMNMNQQGNFNHQGRRHQESRMNNIFKNEYKNFKEIETISLEKGVSILI